MCDLCESEIDKTAAKIKGRYKLWELPRHHHCPIIGTCLTLAELHRVQRNCSLSLPSNYSDYQLHTAIVGQAEHNGAVAHRINKLLERKFKRWIKVYGQLESHPERLRFWTDALKHGEISGPLWALLSHRISAQQLVDQALGDVHMLSHLQGAANRADLKYSSALEHQLAELKQQLEQQRQQSELKIGKNEQLLSAQQNALASIQQRLVPAPESELVIKQQLSESRKQCQLLSRKQTWLVSQLAQREQRLSELEHGHRGLIEQIQETQQERDTLERALNQLLVRCSPETELGDNDAINLKGKKLAYVGGRPTIYPHLKSYVETLNGQLILHDGGQEDSRAELCSSLAGADMVFCPVDCISHDACLRVKKFCKQQQKLFVPLRSASLSAFSNGLRRANQSDDTVVAGGIITTSIRPLAVALGSD